MNSGGIPANQYDRRNYLSDQSWLTWRDADCSAAALDWLLGAYGQTVSSLDDAVALIGPSTVSRRAWASSTSADQLWPRQLAKRRPPRQTA